MKRSSDLDATAIQEMVRVAAERTGLRPDAISDDAVRKATYPLLRSGVQPKELLRRHGATSEQWLLAIMQRVSVAETYFFRHCEQFTYICETFLPAWRSHCHRLMHVWSAGCATGEETYSLSACLLANQDQKETAFNVLGTDVSEERIRICREGIYGRFSLRYSAPLLYPLLHPLAGNRWRVTDAVRAVTRFEVQDLRHPIPFTDRRFDLIFCRNVLKYFGPETSQVICGALSSLLTPEGLLVLGPMDVLEVPKNLVGVGPAELNLFRAEQPAAFLTEPALGLTALRTDAPVRPQRTALSPPNPAALSLPAPPQATKLHLLALSHLERREFPEAFQLLVELGRTDPDYLPGLLERALLHSRRGEPAQARKLMQELLIRTQHLAPNESVGGPEELSGEYYQRAAQAFLGQEVTEQ